MLHAASLMLLNKVDLLPHLDFDVERCVEYARRIRPDLQVLRVSARTGEGLEAWIDWLLAGQEAARAARLQTLDGLRRRVDELEARLASKDA
jgi:hydrogenase nickel incorporation protein HypB